MLEDDTQQSVMRRDKACLVSTTTVTTVPRLNDGSQLQTWAIAHGLPAAPVGFDTPAYYRFLCQRVERMNVVQGK